MYAANLCQGFDDDSPFVFDIESHPAPGEHCHSQEDPAFRRQDEHITWLLFPNDGSEKDIHLDIVTISEGCPRGPCKGEIKIADERCRQGEKAIVTGVDRSLDKSGLARWAEDLNLDDRFFLSGDSPNQHAEATTPFRPRR
jgi:hypothetical protein